MGLEQVEMLIKTLLCPDHLGTLSIWRLAIGYGWLLWAGPVQLALLPAMAIGRAHGSPWFR